jgi:hypothetical protein
MRSFILALIGAVLCAPGSSVLAQIVNTFAVNQPKGIAIDRANNLYVANSGNGSIIRIALNGVTTTFASGFTNLGFIAFDPAGNLYATNTTGSTPQVSKITPNGTVSTFITQVLGPIAFDGSGNLYGVGNPAVSPFSAPIVQVTSNGSLSLLGNVPSNPVQGIAGLRADAVGDVFVSGSPVNVSVTQISSYIGELTPNGKFTIIASDNANFESSRLFRPDSPRHQRQHLSRCSGQY